MPPIANWTRGSRRRAAAIMSGELSRPRTAALGKRAAKTSVELPGPHPRSIAERASIAGKAARRSRTGRVRSSSKVTYCAADQLIAGWYQPPRRDVSARQQVALRYLATDWKTRRKRQFSA